MLFFFFRQRFVHLFVFFLFLFGFDGLLLYFWYFFVDLTFFVKNVLGNNLFS